MVSRIGSLMKSPGFDSNCLPTFSRELAELKLIGVWKKVEYGKEKNIISCALAVNT